MENRTSRTGRFGFGTLAAALVALFLLGAMASSALGDGGTSASSSSSPPAVTVATDKASYLPGDTVLVSGANWLPSESVHVHVADSGSNGFSYDTDLFAGADGTIAASFALPTAFAGDFALVATGGLTESASASFSDAFAPAPAPPPSIISDQADYAPGATVTLTGNGWQPSETVHISVDDNVGQTWHYATDLTADSTGAFTNQLQLPTTFVATYSTTATGALSGTASASFTDRSLMVFTNSGVTATFDYQGFTNSSCTTGAGTLQSNNPFSSTGSPVNSNLGLATFIKFTADSPATSPSTSTFHDWSSQSGSGNTITTTTSSSICVRNPGASQSDAYVATYQAAPTNHAPAVAATNAAVSTAEGSSATNAGTWSDADAGDTVVLSASTGTVTKSGTNAAGTWSWTIPTTDGPAGPTTVTITANDGHTTANTTFTYSVTNVAPTVTAAANQTATVNASQSFTLGTFSDPGSDSPWPVDVDWGDGSPHAAFNVTALDAASGLAITPQSHTYTSAAASPYTVTVKVTDKNGASDSKTFTVAVSKVNQTPLVVTFPTAGTYGDKLTPTASGGSGGGARTFTASGSACSIPLTGTDAGKLLITSGTGTCSVTAHQAADGTFNAADSAPQTVAISARPITVTATTNTKTYDGTTSAAATPAVTSGSLVGGDTPSFSEVYASANAGTAKTLVASGSVSDSNGGNNYAITFGNNTAGVIGQRDVTASIVADTKVYNGNTNATASCSLDAAAGSTGVIAADAANVICSATGASFGSADAGTNKTVTATVGLSGSAATNYHLTSLTATDTNATISKADPTCSIVGYSVTYDSSPHTASGSCKGVDGTTVLAGLVKTGTTHTAAGTYTGDAWTFTDVTGNYHDASGTVNDAIAKATVTVSFQAQDKVYDGNTTATIKAIPTPSLVGVVSGDDVVLGTTSAIATFGTPAVGTGKTVTGSGFTKSGAAADNYVFASPQGTTTAAITAWTALGTGFYAPVGVTNSIFTAAPAAAPTTKPSAIPWNTAKGGQTIPLKFNVFAGTVEKTSLSDIKSFQQQQLPSCGTDVANTDPVDLTTTGGTTLRYDGTGAQWIQNWATAKVSTTTCYRAWVTFADNSTLEAFFQLSK